MFSESECRVAHNVNRYAVRSNPRPSYTRKTYNFGPPFVRASALRPTEWQVEQNEFDFRKVVNQLRFSVLWIRLA